jgi:hypothetical protein
MMARHGCGLEGGSCAGLVCAEIVVGIGSVVVVVEV